LQNAFEILIKKKKNAQKKVSHIGYNLHEDEKMMIEFLTELSL